LHVEAGDTITHLYKYIWEQTCYPSLQIEFKLKEIKAGTAFISKNTTFLGVLLPRPAMRLLRLAPPSGRGRHGSELPAALL